VKKLLALGKKRLRGLVYATSDVSLAHEIGRLFRKKRKTLSVAESCTGGQLAPFFPLRHPRRTSGFNSRLFPCPEFGQDVFPFFLICHE